MHRHEVPPGNYDGMLLQGPKGAIEILQVSTIKTGGGITRVQPLALLGYCFNCRWNKGLALTLRDYWGLLVALVWTTAYLLVEIEQGCYMLIVLGNHCNCTDQRSTIEALLEY